MSLFDEGTVIIVGAGASVPFGLPTGAELIDLIVENFRKEATDISNLPAEYSHFASIPAIAPISYALFFDGDSKVDVRPHMLYGNSITRRIGWLSKRVTQLMISSGIIPQGR